MGSVMLKFNMKKIVSLRGIAKPYAFLINQGFSKYAAVEIMRDKITAPSDKFIEKFCLLFNCVPHDFMEWYPDSETANAENQPLAILIPKENPVEEFKELKKLVYLMPVDKVSELKKKAEELASAKV